MTLSPEPSLLPYLPGMNEPCTLCSSDAVLSCSIVGSELIRRRHPIQELAQSSLADPHDELDEALLSCGVLQRTRVDRLVACISVELLDSLPRLLVPAPQIARPRASFAKPVVERGEVGIERLRRRSVGPRLHVFGVGGEALWGLHAHEVCHVDNRFFCPRVPARCLGPRRSCRPGLPRARRRRQRRPRPLSRSC